MSRGAGHAFVAAAAAAQIAGGLALPFRRTSKIGAALIAAVYLTTAALCVPRIASAPQIYDRWGNFFEQFSLATGALLAYARAAAWPPRSVRTAGRICFGICSASFGTEQAVYLGNTASLVPKWLPPNQPFWAVATTVPFFLAAISLLSNRWAPLAARLLTLMLLAFGVIVWLPLLVSAPQSSENWSETVETFAIAGTAGILRGLLASERRASAAP